MSLLHHFEVVFVPNGERQETGRNLRPPRGR